MGMRAAWIALTIGLMLPGAAAARDSAHYVCSAIVSYGEGDNVDKMGLSIRFDDRRAESGSGREYTLSAVYQIKLFQGIVIDRSDNFGQGKITLKNGSYEYFAGSFKLVQGKNDTYSMVLDGRINDDPFQSKRTAKIKATLPCVDLST